MAAKRRFKLLLVCARINKFCTNNEYLLLYCQRISILEYTYSTSAYRSY